MTNKLVKTAPGATAWDAGAVSVDAQAADLVAKFTLVAGSAGLLVGLVPADSTPAYASIQHGVLAVGSGVLQIVEAGVLQAVSTVPFTSDRPITITRAGTQVTYYLPGWTYVSLVASSGSKGLGAALYAPGDAVDSPQLVAATAEAPGDGSYAESMTVGAGYVLEPLLYAVIEETLTIGGHFDVLLRLDAALAEALYLDDNSNVQMLLNAVLQSRIRFADSASVVLRSLLQYATNLGTGAVGRYEGYDFDGFCRVGMDTYGWKRDGVYKLGGETDNGALIGAIVDLAAENFGTAQGKRLESIYLGLSTDGQVYIRMTDDTDREVTYRARERKTEFRSNMQQGLTSRFWRMRLEIVDASHAVLDNVEWVAAATGRRTST